MLFCSRLFQLSRPPGRKTAVAVWHNGWPSDLDGIRGDVEWRIWAVPGPTGGLSNKRHHSIVWGGQTFLANEWSGIESGRAAVPPGKLAGGPGLRHEECDALRRVEWLSECDMISQFWWFLHQACGMLVRAKFVTWFPISVLDFKAGYLADADVAFELVSCKTFRLI